RKLAIPRNNGSWSLDGDEGSNARCRMGKQKQDSHGGSSGVRHCHQQGRRVFRHRR
ncbi:unnamed protein product, partial [Ascophyllum nodosum]